MSVQLKNKLANNAQHPITNPIARNAARYASIFYENFALLMGLDAVNTIVFVVNQRFLKKIEYHF